MTAQIKAVQRRFAYRARAQQLDKDTLSAIICDRVIAHPAYQKADTVMWYLGCKTEVKTLPAVKAQLSGAKRIVVPYCTHDNSGVRKLGLWLLQDINELVAGTWGILEPPRERWHEANKTIAPHELDLIVTPGVAFDSTGRRLGNGAGYYDRLLAEVDTKTVLFGICFESQMLSSVATEAHDVSMHAVVTESFIYPDRNR